MIATVRSQESVSDRVLYVAFELASRQWKLALTSGFGVAAIVRTVAAGDWEAVTRALRHAAVRFGLPADVPVISCYEAGREATDFILDEHVEEMRAGPHPSAPGPPRPHA